MPYCGSCGKPFEEGDKFCRNCGAPTGAKRPEQKPLGVRGSGSRLALRVVSIIGWFIVSLIVTGLIMAVMAIAVIMPLFGGAQEGGYVFILLSLTIFLVVLYKLRGRFLVWRPRTREEALGREGSLQSTARSVEGDDIQTPWGGIADRILRFRAEMTDPQGNITGYVPVEIRTRQDKWVGQVKDGDKIVVTGRFGRDGTLRAKRAFNLTTNSNVGEA